jgi:hypothetical protein
MPDDPEASIRLTTRRKCRDGAMMEACINDLSIASGNSSVPEDWR